MAFAARYFGFIDDGHRQIFGADPGASVEVSEHDRRSALIVAEAVAGFEDSRRAEVGRPARWVIPADLELGETCRSEVSPLHGDELRIVEDDGFGINRGLQRTSPADDEQRHPRVGGRGQHGR